MTKRTRRESLAAALTSGFLTLISLGVLTTEQSKLVSPPVLVLACVIVIVAILRNQIFVFVFQRVSFATHYRLKSVVAPFAASFMGLVLGLIFSGAVAIERRIYGPIMAVGLVIAALGYAFGWRIVTQKGQASLEFAQSIYEATQGRDMIQTFRWLDRGLYSIFRIIKQYGIKVNASTQRVGARLYFSDKAQNIDILRKISDKILEIENPIQFSEIIKALEAFETAGKQAISKGISAQPRFDDCLDYSHLSLRNIYLILLIIVVLVGIWTGRLPLP
jgi:hypothetical protein